jgi:hypothetical protein
VVYTNAYPTYANYAKMLEDTRKNMTKNMQNHSNILNAHMDKHEGKTTDCNQPGAGQQLWFGMRLTFMKSDLLCFC